MSKEQKKIVFYLYNRLFDPVIQSNIFLYIRELAARTGSPYRFAIITYEDPKLPATAEQLTEIRAFFAQHRVEWIPLTWHAGTSLKQKGLDVLAGLRVLSGLRLRGYRYLVTLASIAGAYGYLFSLAARYRLYLYQFEPHSDFAVEAGLWSPGGRQYKIAKYLETKAALFASVISTGTDRMIATLRSWGSRAEIVKVTSVVNEDFFRFDAPARERVRSELGVSPGTPVIIYSGKFGDLYYGREIIDALRIIKENIPEAFFLILSPTDRGVIESWIGDSFVAGKDYLLRSVNYTEMPAYLSAADFGINAIPPTPAQVYRSPIKTGEYLCVGLPYLVCRGISEDDQVAEREQVGVVVADFSDAEIRRAIPEIRSYLAAEKTALRERCRRTGIEYRGYSVMRLQFEKALAALVGRG
jgi:hypothetical protein